MFPCCNVPAARGCPWTQLDIPYTYHDIRCIWCPFGMCADRLEVYQRLFVCVALRTGALCLAHDDTHGMYRCHTADAFARTYDSSLLCLDRYDLRSYAHSWHTQAGRFDEDYAFLECRLCHSRSCKPWSAGLLGLHCRDDNLCRFVWECRHIPPHGNNHCMYKYSCYGSLHSACCGQDTFPEGCRPALWNTYRCHMGWAFLCLLPHLQRCWLWTCAAVGKQCHRWCCRTDTPEHPVTVNELNTDCII